VTTRWLTPIMACLAAACGTVGTAAALGPDGKGTTVVIGCVMSMMAVIVTGSVASADRATSTHLADLRREESRDRG
jgi:hypothetical protein